MAAGEQAFVYFEKENHHHTTMCPSLREHYAPSTGIK
jgi:hypothetical protein